MSEISNRRNLDFLFDQVFDLASILCHERFSAYDRAAVTQILDAAEAIAKREFLPIAALVDAQEPVLVDGRVVTPPQTAKALSAYAEAGLFSTGLSEADGGSQMPWMVNLPLKGLFCCANLPVVNYALLTEANAAVIATFGSEDQRRTYLPPMLEGRWFGTMCLSEPQAGSSLSDINTMAVPAPDLGPNRYRLRGSKMWISGGDQEISENIIHLVLARTPDAPAGVKGLSLFIVPKHRPSTTGGNERNDVTTGGLNHKMGQRGISNCLLNFGDEDDCQGELLGELNSGLNCMFHMMNEARINVGYGASMTGQAGYFYSLDYARTRLQGRRPGERDRTSPPVPIIEHPDIKRMLLAQKVAVEGAEALAVYCARLVDLGKIGETESDRKSALNRLELITPIMKSWPSEHCLEANKLAIQILGGYGYTREFPVERLYRDNRLNHIHEGALGIQGIDLLGRKVRLYADDLKQLFSEIRSLTESASEQIIDDARKVQSALDRLESATQRVAECGDPIRATANATLYLDAFGHVLIGWMWLIQAISALKAIDQSGEDPFYRGKISAFQYFCRYEVVRVHNWLYPVIELDETCIRITPQEFVGL